MITHVYISVPGLDKFKLVQSRHHQQNAHFKIGGGGGGGMTFPNHNHSHLRNGIFPLKTHQLVCLESLWFSSIIDLWIKRER